MTTINTQQHTPIIQGFLLKLKSRNKELYYFGWLQFAAALICGMMTFSDPGNIVLGINAWIKPFKFFISIGILSWTLSWLLVYWQNRKAVRIYSLVAIITMLIEMGIITWQAANGRLSHFNISTPLYSILFMVMGIAITLFTIWTLYMNLLFFRQKNFPLWMSEGYKWGIRWGMLLFVLFAFEGGLMASQLQHTIGSPDGGEGLPLLNWSTEYGDLRVAHFFGMHALQLLPLCGYYFAQTRTQIHLLSFVYFLSVSLLFWQALEGYPL
jgi:hypothetical protein